MTSLYPSLTSGLHKDGYGLHVYHRRVIVSNREAQENKGNTAFCEHESIKCVTTHCVVTTWCISLPDCCVSPSQTLYSRHTSNTHSTIYSPLKLKYIPVCDLLHPWHLQAAHFNFKHLFPCKYKKKKKNGIKRAVKRFERLFLSSESTRVLRWLGVYFGFCSWSESLSRRRQMGRRFLCAPGIFLWEASDYRSHRGSKKKKKKSSQINTH